MSQSENDDMQRAGEAMKEAGQDLQNQSGEGKESGGELRQRTAPNRRVRTDRAKFSLLVCGSKHSTQDASIPLVLGDTSFWSGETAQDKLNRLQQQLRDNERLAERMKQDAERLKQARD